MRKNEDSYVRTHSGINFYMLKPKAEDILIDDIAHSLSRICRYNGHTSEFYTVAQHSIACSYLVKEEFSLEALLHDSTEAVCSDLPSPIKILFPDFIEMENDIYEVIAEKFGVSKKIPKEVHFVDKMIVKQYEWDYFMLKKPNPKHKEFYRRFFEFRGFEQTKKEFLDRFYELQNIKIKKQSDYILK